MKVNCGDVVKGYTVLTICEQQYYGVALVTKKENDLISYAVFDYYMKYDTDYWKYFDNQKEAEMDFFERMPIMLDKYDIADIVNDEDKM